MRFLIALVFLGCLGVAQAQKLIRKSITNNWTKSISIDLSNCYSLDLKTSKSNEIVIKGSVAGADNDDVLVNIQEDGSNIEISTGFQPNYVERGTKFGALTFVAIDLDISVPEQLLINLFGTSTRILAEGNYQKIDVTLSDGDCILNGFFEVASVKTQNGDITLKSAKGEVEAHSTYGEVFLEHIPKGNSVFKLNSVQGDIYVNRTD